MSPRWLVSTACRLTIVRLNSRTWMTGLEVHGRPARSGLQCQVPSDLVPLIGIMATIKVQRRF